MNRGFTCGDGWFNIIDTFCSQVQWQIQHCEMPPVVARQVKEKLGTLRIYYRGGNEVTSGIKLMAEAMSACTCEICGCPSLHYDDFHRQMTRCQEHVEAVSD